PTAIARVVAEVESVLDEAEIGVHCHDDCGLAVANTLAGFAAGADVGAVTVNGIGERAGNAPLGAVAVALEALHGVETGIDTTTLTTLSRAVAHRSGIDPAPTQPVVGEHSFVHESGIHVDALVRDPSTSEGLDPSAVGQSRDIRVGKHSGSTARAVAAGQGPASERSRGSVDSE
ncbi:MAG: homocitrate synthase/isopropylmalate synthase family protein, partial [Halococcoides sp.]